MTRPSEPRYDLFVSFCDSDAQWVRRFLLPALGLSSGQVITKDDFELGVAAGKEYERAVSDSRYAALVFSPAYLDDAWAGVGEQLATYARVEGLLDRLVPLKRHPCTLPLQHRSVTFLDCTDEENWEREAGRLRDLLQKPKPGPEPIPCPYPGMVPFESRDYFFGRDEEIEALASRVRGGQRYLFVIGPSGSGKSSLVRAGLLPELARDATSSDGPRLTRVFRPGARPTDELIKALGGDPDRPPDVLTDLPALRPGSPRLLLVVDQFEEVFTLPDGAERSRFLRALNGLRGSERFSLLMVMRADFFPDLMNSDLSRVDSSEIFPVAPLRGDRLRQAVQRPAEAVGVSLEERLLDRLMYDATDAPGVLPLLQETMVRLWDERSRKRRLITLQSYERMGKEGRSGLAEAIALKAGVTFANLTPAHRVIARRIFLRLVSFGEGRDDTRRQQSVSALRPAEGDERARFDQTLDTLAAHRLLTVSGEPGDPDRKVDLAHEAMIRSWPALRQWLIDYRKAEQTRRRLEDKVKEWERLGRRGGLLDEVELHEAETWASFSENMELGDIPSLDPLVRASREVLETSLEQAKAAAASLRRRARVLMATLAVALALAGASYLLFQKASKETVIAEQATGSAKQQAEIARKESARATAQEKIAEQEAARARAQADIARAQADIARSRQLGLQSMSFKDDRYDLSLLLASEALLTRDTHEARTGMLNRMKATPLLAQFAREHRSRVVRMAYSRDGKILARAGLDSRIILWDAESHRPLGSLTDYYSHSPVACLLFGPDGKTLATCHDAGTVLRWDLTKLKARPGHLEVVKPGDFVNRAAFSPDGTLLAIGAKEGTITLWNVNTLKPFGKPMEGPPGPVWSLAFSPDGKTLASGTEEKTVILWDCVSQARRATLAAGRRTTAWDLAFSPDGKTLATANSDDYSVTLWDLSAETPRAEPLMLHQGLVRCVAFSPDGKMLASAGDDRHVVLCDVAKRRMISEPLWGQADSIWSLAFSPDGRSLASGGNDGSVVFWDLSRSGTRLYRLLRAGEAVVTSVALSPDGKTAATGGADGATILWDLATRPPLGKPLTDASNSVVRDVCFNHDGSVLAASRQNGDVMLWDVDSGKPLGVPLARQGVIAGRIAFSPDGTLLAAGYLLRGPAWDGVMVWDLVTRKVRAKLPGTAGGVETGPGGQTSPVFASSNPVFSPDGKTLAVGLMFGKVLLWDVAANRPVGPPVPTLDDEAVMSLAYSPDGKTLAVGGFAKRVALVNLAERRLVAEPVTAHQGYVTCVDFSPDGKTLASCDLEGSLFLWDVATFQPIGEPLSEPGRTMWKLAFSPDSKTLATTDSRPHILLWDVSVESWRKTARRTANRNLSLAEWKQYIGAEVPYHRTFPDLPPGDGVTEGAEASTGRPPADPPVNKSRTK